jgi:hypothetical protein
LWIFGLVADLLGVNRKMLEEIQLRIRRSEYDSSARRRYTSSAFSSVEFEDKK